MRPLAFLGVLATLLGSVLLGPMLGIGAAEAHVRTTTVTVDLHGEGDRIAATVVVEHDVLARALGPDRAGDSEAAAYVGSRLVLTRGGLACAPGDDASVDVRDADDGRTATVGLAYECAATGALTVRSEIFRATDGVIDDATVLVTYDVDGRTGSTVLDAGHPSLTLGRTDVLAEVPRFLLLGAEHLVLGLDHVLFLLALLLGARSLRDVVKVATAFTLAHSVTLVLAAIGLVSVPSWIVEPLIALSIAFVALDNLLSPRTAHRLPIVFGFGLLHGLGFAGTISVDGPLSWSVLVGLLSFNVGIELAQVALIAVAFPVLQLLRRHATTPAAARVVAVGTVAATLVVAGAGLFWFAERAPLLA